jgi:oligoribonuclease (3'-5' exoribonuclease)
LTGRALKAREEHEKLHNRLTKQVPDAPFKKDWHEMVLKHLIAHAVKNGYDALAVTPGEEQAKRYDLSKHIDQLTSYRRPGGKYMLSMQAKGKQFPEPPHEVEESDLERAVGKDLAAKIREHKDDIVPWRGLDLQVGGEGMKGFYDKMVPAFLNKIGKPFGAQVRPLTVSEMKPSVTMSEVMDALAAAGHSQHEINNNPELYRQMGERMRAERDEQPNDEYTLHGFPITPEMRQHVENEGLPLFAKGGDVHDTPEFKRWFRRSVLRDDEGKPMVLYHATPRDFKEFKPGGPDPDISGRAIWLSASKEHQPAAHHTRMVPGQPGRVYRHTVDKFTPGTNVMPLYARMENPLWVDEDMKNEIRQRHGLSRAFPTLVTDKDLEILRRGGYDSVIHTGLDKNLGGNEYVALDPHQIKSAIGNRGTFDPNDPDITKASGGAVEPEPTMGGDVHDTPEFKRWFRRSVLRDDEGKPMVLYHATPRDFKEFKPGGPDPDISGRAIWLSASKEHQPAAHHTRMVPGQPGRVYRHTVDKFTPGTNVMPLYARMENPLWVDEDMKNEIRQRHGLSRAFPTLVTDKDLEILRRGGYDSVIHTGLDKNLGGNEYVALDPHQIKSAIGNRGTFDPNDPDITKASGGAVEPEPTMGALAALRRRS